MDLSGIDEVSNYDSVNRLEITNGELTSDSAERIADWLIAKYRSRLIYSCIDDVFGDLPESEREAVFEGVCNIISGRYSLKHLEYIKQKILDFFESNNAMNIDGFVNFRLRAYKDELKILVEECGYDLMGERDYNELLEIIDFLLNISDYY